MRALFEILDETGPQTQQSAAMVISRVVQNAPGTHFSLVSSFIIENLINSIKRKPKGGLLESLETLTAAVLLGNSDSAPPVDTILGILIEQVCSGNPSIRKASLDTLHALCVMHPEDLKFYREEVEETIAVVKNDSDKRVADAAQATLRALRGVIAPQDDSRDPVIRADNSTSTINHLGTTQAQSRPTNSSTNSVKNGNKKPVKKEYGVNKLKMNPNFMKAGSDEIEIFVSDKRPPPASTPSQPSPARQATSKTNNSSMFQTERDPTDDPYAYADGLARERDKHIMTLGSEQPSTISRIKEDESNIFRGGLAHEDGEPTINLGSTMMRQSVPDNLRPGYGWGDEPLSNKRGGLSTALNQPAQVVNSLGGQRSSIGGRGGVEQIPRNRTPDRMHQSEYPAWAPRREDVREGTRLENLDGSQTPSKPRVDDGEVKQLRKHVEVLQKENASQSKAIEFQNKRIDTLVSHVQNMTVHINHLISKLGQVEQNVFQISNSRQAPAPQQIIVPSFGYPATTAAAGLAPMHFDQMSSGMMMNGMGQHMGNKWANSQMGMANPYGMMGHSSQHTTPMRIQSVFTQQSGPQWAEESFPGKAKGENKWKNRAERATQDQATGQLPDARETGKGKKGSGEKPKKTSKHVEKDRSKDKHTKGDGPKVPSGRLLEYPDPQPSVPAKELARSFPKTGLQDKIEAQVRETNMKRTDDLAGHVTLSAYGSPPILSDIARDSMIDKDILIEHLESEQGAKSRSEKVKNSSRDQTSKGTREVTGVERIVLEPQIAPTEIQGFKKQSLNHKEGLKPIKELQAVTPSQNSAQGNSWADNAQRPRTPTPNARREDALRGAEYTPQLPPASVAAELARPGSNWTPMTTSHAETPNYGGLAEAEREEVESDHQEHEEQDEDATEEENDDQSGEEESQGDADEDSQVSQSEATEEEQDDEDNQGDEDVESEGEYTLSPARNGAAFGSEVKEFNQALSRTLSKEPRRIVDFLAEYENLNKLNLLQPELAPLLWTKIAELLGSKVESTIQYCIPWVNTGLKLKKVTRQQQADQLLASVKLIMNPNKSSSMYQQTTLEGVELIKTGLERLNFN